MPYVAQALHPFAGDRWVIERENWGGSCGNSINRHVNAKRPAARDR